MTPGGDVVWLAMLRKMVEYEAVYLRRQAVVQADAKGVAELPVADGVPPQAIWIAIDLKTGAYAMASPAGFSPLPQARRSARWICRQAPSEPGLAPPRISSPIVAT